MASDQNPPESPETTTGGLEPIPPGKRKRLQQMFEHANRMMAQDNFDYASELLSQCVTGDPSNFAYLQAFLANLKKKYGNNKKGHNMAFMKKASLGRAVSKAAGQKDWLGVIRSGVESLRINPWEIPILRQMADAVKELGCDEVELVYLKTALEANHKDFDVNWRCAQALKERKQYDQAIACLHRCEQIRPGDEGVQRAIASLAVEKTLDTFPSESNKKKKAAAPGAAPVEEETQIQKLEKNIAKHPDDLPRHIELADLYLQDEIYDKAVEILTKALELSKGDADIRERLEEAQVRRMRNEMLLLRKKLDEKADPQVEAELKDLKLKLAAKELEVYQARVERYPSNFGFKYDLAVRFQLLSRYKEAIGEFQEAQKDPRFKGRSLLALGQCFQHIKQYNLAMRHYEQANEEIPDRDADNKKLTLYRAGKLALFLKDLAVAERYLTTLAGLDFSYRDVAELLDNIAKLKDDNGDNALDPDQ
jgi:tetratricopeptide (TPR) repeat protein